MKDKAPNIPFPFFRQLAEQTDIPTITRGAGGSVDGRLIPLPLPAKKKVGQKRSMDGTGETRVYNIRRKETRILLTNANIWLHECV